ncbi:glycerol-3-phosphate acyltransferase 4-like isoform X5 [Callithrix jacchus]
MWGWVVRGCGSRESMNMRLGSQKLWEHGVHRFEAETKSPCVAQAGFHLLNSSKPAASASQSAGITVGYLKNGAKSQGEPPALQALHQRNHCKGSHFTRRRDQEDSSSGSSKALDNTPELELSDIFYFCQKGMETIMDDEVTERFSAEELESWNLLSRTNYNLHSISLRLKVLWGLGVLIRYCFLLPLRFKEFVSKHVHSMCHRICARALTAIITYHDREDRPRNGGICVANHTSPIDVIILASDGYYTMVGQVHGGLMGVIQRAMVKACPHIWLRGTCINNTSVMMFKRGSFEIGATVYPVAIKITIVVFSNPLLVTNRG